MELTNNEILEVNLLNDFETIVIESDDKIEQIVKAVSSQTRRRILREIQVEPMDVSNIAAKLEMTEANISAQIKKLENAGLIICEYSSGQHGVRKISRLKYHKITIAF